MRISDWSSDVCSSDLPRRGARIRERQPQGEIAALARLARHLDRAAHRLRDLDRLERTEPETRILRRQEGVEQLVADVRALHAAPLVTHIDPHAPRSGYRQIGRPAGWGIM